MSVLGDGLDYHFITRSQFDESIAQGSFLEYGMNKSGALYGTLLSEVQRIIEENRIPLLCPPPQSLEKIKNKEFKAHVVFLKVSPPQIEKIDSLFNIFSLELIWPHREKLIQ